MRRELDLQKAVRSGWPSLARYVGDEGRFLPRTILFHLAYEIFGSIGVPPSGFISTNITNLDKPLQKKRRMVEDPMLESIGIRLPDTHRWEATILSYNVDIIVGAQRMEMAKPVFQQVVAAAAQFNQLSRLLKIGKFRCAWSQSRGVSRHALQYDPVSIPAGA
jgi:hypothetical protein